MKRLIESLLFCSIAGTTILPLVTTSCSKNDGLFITAKTFSYLTTERSIMIEIEFQKTPNCEVFVQLEDVAENIINLRQNIFNVFKKTLNIYVDLSDDVIDDTLINFNLSFFLKNKVGGQQNFKLYDFVYYYQKHDPTDDDLLSIESKTCHSINNHVFSYDLYFNNYPVSDAVKVELLDEPSGQLSLRSSEFPIKKTEMVMSTIILDLNLSIYQNQAFSFNFRFSFTNSKGKEQTTTLYGLAALFERERVDELPREYLDLVNLPSSDKKLLKGIKPAVNPLDLPSYNSIIIPDDVAEIAENAFADPSKFPNVFQLSIPQTVTTIGANAFNGLVSLNELDLSNYITIPQWCTEQPDLHIFDSNPMKFSTGYVWNNDDVSSDELHDILVAKGLPQDWCNYSVKNVTQPDFFEIEEEGGTVTGISDEGLKIIDNIKIIKFPKNARSIEVDALTPLKTKPYIGPNGFETRKLVLNHDLKSIAGGAFQNLGIAGPIIIQTPYLPGVISSTFYNCSKYDDPLITQVQADPIHLYFIACNNLVSIDSFAFDGANIIDDELPLPQNIEKIGDMAFQGCSFSSIKLPQQLKNLGIFAFANTYSEEPLKRLTTIDLSSFKEILNPEEEPSHQTHIPAWFEEENNFTFLNSCVDTGNIILNQVIKKEVQEREDNADVAKWEKKFKINHGIPMDWTFEYVDD